MSTNLDSMFKTNKDLEVSGVNLIFDNGVMFRVRRFGGGNSQRVKQAMNKHYKPVAKLLESGALPADQDHEITVKAFVESCLITWEGIEKDGKVLEFSEHNAIELFKSLPELFRVVFDYASSGDSYKEDLGNS